MGGRGSSSTSANNTNTNTTIKINAQQIQQMAAAGDVGQPNFNPNNIQPPTIQEVLAGNVTPIGGVDFNKFMGMTDDEKADVIADALQTPTPLFLDDSPLQRLAYFTGLNQKPQVVSDAQLDKMQGKELFRTVHNVYNSQTDVNYSAQDIVDQIAMGDYTMYSDSGGSAYGRGIYFADNYHDSAVYYRGGRTNLTQRAKILPSSKGISESRALNGARAEIKKGTKIGKALAIAQQMTYGTDIGSMWALIHGYDYITTGNSYNVVLNRGCLAVSSTAKATNPNAYKW